jgi:hypothetical protein
MTGWSRPASIRRVSSARTPRLDQRPGPPGHLPAHQVQDQVDPVDGILEPPLADVHDLGGAQVGQQRTVWCPPGREHLGAGGVGELHGEHPDPAGCAVDEHPLAGLPPAVVCLL